MSTNVCVKTLIRPSSVLSAEINQSFFFFQTLERVQNISEGQSYQKDGILFPEKTLTNIKGIVHRKMTIHYLLMQHSSKYLLFAFHRRKKVIER